MKGVTMAQGINVYLQYDVINALRKRNKNGESIGWFANQEIERLYALYEDALNSIKLTQSEACFIVDMLNATIMDEKSARMLWAEADDAIKLDNLDQKWIVDGEALISKLRGLTTIQAMAIVDASNRFWATDENERVTDMFETVKKCFNIKQN
jgi:hypothetical protein